MFGSRHTILCFQFLYFLEDNRLEDYFILVPVFSEAFQFESEFSQAQTYMEINLEKTKNVLT